MAVKAKSYYGTAVLGDVTISSNVAQTNTSALVSSFSGKNVTLSNKTVGDIGGDFQIGDEVMLHASKGNVTTAGHYAFMTVDGVSGNDLLLNSVVDNTKFTSGNFQVVKVLHFNNLTINAGITMYAKTLDAYFVGGILAMRVSGKMTLNGIISATKRGYSSILHRSNQPNYADFGGQGQYMASGGGSHQFRGGYGGSRSGYGNYPSGNVLGTQDLSKLYLGMAGGRGQIGHDSNNSSDSVPGGSGGGIIFIAARSLVLGASGEISSNGGGGYATSASSWTGGAGGGAGGSVYLVSQSISNPRNYFAGATGGGGSGVNSGSVLNFNGYDGTNSVGGRGGSYGSNTGSSGVQSNGGGGGGHSGSAYSASATQGGMGGTGNSPPGGGGGGGGYVAVFTAVQPTVTTFPAFYKGEVEGLTVGDISYNSPVNREEAKINFTMYNTTSDNLLGIYRVSVNGEIVIPFADYVPLPWDVTAVLQNAPLKIGNNTITVELNDNQGNVSFTSFTIVKINVAPSPIITPSPAVCHKENVALEIAVDEADKDAVKFQVFVNGKQKFPEVGYTELLRTPFSYVVPIRNNELVIGDNTIKVSTVDEYGAETIKNIIVKKTNILPAVENPSVRGQMVFARLSDKDGDLLRYKILVNSTQVHPPISGTWSAYLKSPVDVQFRIPNNFISFGNTHKVEIVVEDDMGQSSNWVTNSLIDYAGLMFTDETGLYYSTDLGQVIKYLELGTIVAGNASNVFEVYLKNTVGYKVTNIRLSPAQKDLDPVTEKVEISLTKTPFDPKPYLEVPLLQHGEKVPFYVRVNTTRQAISGGLFDVRVVGDPA
jgi:hypothetical protein